MGFSRQEDEWVAISFSKYSVTKPKKNVMVLLQSYDVLHEVIQCNAKLQQKLKIYTVPHNTTLYWKMQKAELGWKKLDPMLSKRGKFYV